MEYIFVVIFKYPATPIFCKKLEITESGMLFADDQVLPFDHVQEVKLMTLEQINGSLLKPFEV
jgi:hypothetical protein